MRRIVFFCFAAVLLAGDTGTTVRPSASDYDAQGAVRGTTIAASVLSRDQTARIFSASVSRNFTVVEIAVYPANGRAFDLAALDFDLKTGPDDRIFAAAPEEVAWHGKRQPALSSGPLSSVNVITEAGVGVGARTNPATGRTEHGVAAYGGVAVDTRPAPNSQTQSRSADAVYMLEGKLRGLQLQEGQTTRPVSGYLYFAANRKKQKAAPLVLEYSRSGERALLNLPNR